jgi:hypothetical protein
MNDLSKIGIDLKKLGTRVAEAGPKTVGEQHLQGGNLLSEPKPLAKAPPKVRPDMDAIIHDPTYRNLLAFLVHVLGQKDFDEHSRFWRGMAYDHPQKLHECLLEVRAMKMEGRGPANPGGYLRTMLKDVTGGKSRR